MSRLNPRTLIKTNSLRLTPRIGKVNWIRNFSQGSLKIGDLTDRKIGEITRRVDRERLWKELHYTCQWGRGEQWGTYVWLLSLNLNFGIWYSGREEETGNGGRRGSEYEI